jgi:uncharacterized protein (TIGR03435 family)
MTCWNSAFIRPALLWAAAPVFVGCLSARLSPAQSPAATPRLEFEVASIKLNKSSDARVLIGARGGRFTATNVPLQSLMTRAYKIKEIQLSGAPAWLISDRYDIEAKAEGSPNPDEMRAMLQALFEDRLHLKFHREMKELPIYALVVAKPGKLKGSEGECADATLQKAPRKPGEPPAVPCGRVTTFDGHLLGEKIGIEQLIEPLSQLSGRIVLDKTNLTGKYDINVQYTPERRQLPASLTSSPADLPLAPQAADPSGPPLFTAIQDQLGLKLESKKEPVEIMVIDHIERPSDN